MTIGEIIKKRRLELGLTLEEVGKKVGVGKSTVRKWESGMIANMKRDKIEALSDVLQISPVALLRSTTSAEISLNEKEKRLILAYRKNAGMQDAVDKLLGVSSGADAGFGASVAADAAETILKGEASPAKTTTK